MPDPLVYLIAGEPSGDNLGGRIMAALKARAAVPLAFAGVGGERMLAEGLAPVLPMDEITAFGMAEIVHAVPRLYRRMRRLAADIRARRPAVALTIDNTAFSFGVAARARQAGVPLVHLNAPKVWAYRPGRARRAARLYDHLLCLLPFEPPYFHREGLPASFIGHPVVESAAGRGDGPGFRARHGIGGDAPVLCVLPGSRQGEVRRHARVFGEAVRRVAPSIPGLRTVVPSVGALEAAVRAEVADWPGAPLVTGGEPERFDAFAAADLALAASGTVSLELALAGVPMVIGYRMARLTELIVDRAVRVNWASIANLILGRSAIPELLLEECTAERLADALLALWRDPAARATQARDCRAVLAALGQGLPPSLRAADILLDIARIPRRTIGRDERRAP